MRLQRNASVRWEEVAPTLRLIWLRKTTFTKNIEMFFLKNIEYLSR